MELLAKADIARLERKPRLLKGSLTRSLALEEEAASYYATRYEIEPTRSQLYKGAALIALRLNDWRRAERLVALALSGDPPSHNAEELRNIYEDIHFSRHILSEKVRLSEDEIDLTVAGNAVGFGVAEKDEVFRRVEVLQTIFIRGAERRRDMPFRRRGRPAAEVSRDVQLFLATPRAASFGMTIKLGSDQGSLPGMNDTASIVQDALSALEAFNLNSEERLSLVIPDDDYRRNFVSVARELLPDGKKVKTVHLAADGDNNRRVVSLTRSRRESGPDVTRASGRGKGREPFVTLVGEIRVMDSRADTEYIALISDGGRTSKLYAPGEVMTDVLPHYYKTRVRVVARQEGQRLIYVDIDRLDDDGPE